MNEQFDKTVIDIQQGLVVLGFVQDMPIQIERFDDQTWHAHVGPARWKGSDATPYGALLALRREIIAEVRKQVAAADALVKWLRGMEGE